MAPRQEKERRRDDERSVGEEPHVGIAIWRTEMMGRVQYSLAFDFDNAILLVMVMMVLVLERKQKKMKMADITLNELGGSISGKKRPCPRDRNH